MNKAIKYGIIGFLIFLSFSIIVFVISNIIQNNKQKSEDSMMVEADSIVTVDIEKLIDKGTWYDIAE